MNVNWKRITRLTDIDGTLVKYRNSYEEMLELPMEPLPGVVDKLRRWRENGDYILLTTARAEEHAARTEEQLKEAGIIYDKLVCGITAGLRILYNDNKPNMPVTAKAYTLERDAGIAAIDDDEY